MLDDFVRLIGPESGYPLDLPISLRILRLLLYYYQSVQDLERIVYTMDWCANYDYMMKSHTSDYDTIPYSLMAEYAKKRGITLTEPVIDLEKEAPMMEEIKRHLEAVFAQEDVESWGMRISMPLYIARTDYHLGKYYHGGTAFADQGVDSAAGGS